MQKSISEGPFPPPTTDHFSLLWKIKSLKGSRKDQFLGSLLGLLVILQGNFYLQMENS